MRGSSAGSLRLLSCRLHPYGRVHAGTAHADLELLAGACLRDVCLADAQTRRVGVVCQVRYEECDTIDTARSQDRYSNALAWSPVALGCLSSRSFPLPGPHCQNEHQTAAS